MEYAQLNEARTEAIQVNTHGNVEWDANNFCTAAAIIKDGLAEQFRVVELIETPGPAFNAMTHVCMRDGCEKVNDVWQYKWKIEPLPTEQIQIKIDALKVEKNKQINEWRAAANQTYFTHQDKQIACDQLSRSDIDAVAANISLTGGFPVGFPGGWKAKDNTYVVLANIDAFKDMYASMTAQGAANFTKSQSLKAAVTAATSAEQINAIVW